MTKERILEIRSTENTMVKSDWQVVNGEITKFMEKDKKLMDFVKSVAKGKAKNGMAALDIFEVLNLVDDYVNVKGAYKAKLDSKKKSKEETKKTKEKTSKETKVSTTGGVDQKEIKKKTVKESKIKKGKKRETEIKKSKESLSMFDLLD